MNDIIKSNLETMTSLQIAEVTGRACMGKNHWAEISAQ